MNRDTSPSSLVSTRPLWLNDPFAAVTVPTPGFSVSWVKVTVHSIALFPEVSRVETLRTIDSKVLTHLQLQSQLLDQLLQLFDLLMSITQLFAEPLEFIHVKPFECRPKRGKLRKRLVPFHE
jgi:hypothetical protein